MIIRIVHEYCWTTSKRLALSGVQLDIKACVGVWAHPGRIPGVLMHILAWQHVGCEILTIPFRDWNLLLEELQKVLMSWPQTQEYEHPEKFLKSFVWICCQKRQFPSFASWLVKCPRPVVRRIRIILNVIAIRIWNGIKSSCRRTQNSQAEDWWLGIVDGDTMSRTHYSTFLHLI